MNILYHLYLWCDAERPLNLDVQSNITFDCQYTSKMFLTMSLVHISSHELYLQPQSFVPFSFQFVWDTAGNPQFPVSGMLKSLEPYNVW